MIAAGEWVVWLFVGFVVLAIIGGIIRAHEETSRTRDLKAIRKRMEEK